MCEHGTTVQLSVCVPACDAFEGVDTWKMKHVDSCLAPIVAALNDAGIFTRSCCCGHGGGMYPEILLHDGRALVIYPNAETGALAAQTPAWAVRAYVAIRCRGVA